MKLLRVLTLLIVMSGFAMNANAGKVEDVQDAVKKACGKDVSGPDALRLVKSLFMCAPGESVDADGCKVTCLKKVEGSEVGK